MPESNNTVKELQQLLQQGQLAKVEQVAQQALQENNDQQVRYILAVSYRLSKQHEKAIHQLQILLSDFPEHARAYQELGYNYRVLGDTEKASHNFYQATKCNPALLTAWQALLPIYQKFNQYQAIELCQKQIDSLAALPKALLAANDLMHEGNITGADGLCRQYLQENKHSITALLLLAEIATRLKAVSEAEFILETCAELDPTINEVQYQLFKVYSKLGKFSKALSLAERLIIFDQDNMFYQVALATAKVGVGDVQEAISLYRNIIQQGRDEANVHLLLGHALKNANDIENSVNAYRTAYQKDKFCGDAYWSLANTKTYQFTDTELVDMQFGVKAEQVSIANKIHLHFALGKAYEDRRDYALSFQHYKQGNQLQNQQQNYSAARQQHFIQNQINTFSPEFVASLANVGHQDPAPIFIVGMPRAGSTLLEQILASHSLVDGTMELHEILGLAARLSKKIADKPTYPQNLTLLPKHYLAEFGQQFIDSTQLYRQSAPYFIDKMPNNFMHVGLIKSILPKAKIIDARRGAMACCFSGFKQLFGEGQEFSYSLTDIASYYKNYVKMMDHWQSVYPNDILLVRYEDMVADTTSQIKRLLAYCQLPFEQACVEFYKNKRQVKTPSAEQVRQPIYQTGLEQWRHFEPYLDELATHLASD